MNLLYSKLKSSLGIGLFLTSISYSYILMASSNIRPQVKPAPEVTFDRVEEIFGYDLDTEDTVLKNLLLAIAIDHTSPKSPNINEEIGIPFIVDRGPNYWVSRLTEDKTNLSAIVNNALMLLFTKEDIPGARGAANKLMNMAANKGYWPANYYVADNNLMESLTKDNSKPSMVQSNAVPGHLKELAQDTMDRFSLCSEQGFAPCQYRIGFWLLTAKNSAKDGIKVLRQAIRTTLADSRYDGVVDGALVMAAKEIVLRGKEYGIDEVVRQQYVNLVQAKMAEYAQKYAGLVKDDDGVVEQKK